MKTNFTRCIRQIHPSTMNARSCSMGQFKKYECHIPSAKKSATSPNDSFMICLIPGVTIVFVCYFVNYACLHVYVLYCSDENRNFLTKMNRHILKPLLRDILSNQTVYLAEDVTYADIKHIITCNLVTAKPTHAIILKSSLVWCANDWRKYSYITCTTVSHLRNT